MSRKSIQLDVLKRVVADAGQLFATRDVSEDERMRHAHPELVDHSHYHAFVGGALSDHRVALGIVEVQKATARGSRWQKRPEQKAGFWIRVAAHLIDELALMLITSALMGAVGGTAGAVGGALTGAVYHVTFWTTGGQTIGHKLFGLRVVKTDGNPLSIGDAIVRYFGYVVAGAVLCIGLIWVAFDANKQGWHDKIAKTHVVKV